MPACPAGKELRMGGKILAWVLAVVLLLAGGSVLLGTASLSGLEKGDPVGITLYQPGSELNGVFLEGEGYSWGTKEEPPVLAVRWLNKSDAEFTFGAAFDVLYKEQGEWVSCVKPGGTAADAIGYVLKPGEQLQLEYSLGDFDMSRTGDYRFQVCPDGEHNLWLDFALRYRD